MASAIKNFGISPYFSMNLQRPFQSRYPNRCSSANRDSTVTSTSKVNGAVDALAYAVKEETKRDSKVKDFDVEKLEPLWDDGYGTETVKNFQDYAVDLIKPDGGPPRWFSPVSCGPHLRNSPVLLFLPGMDGLGAGLLLHHKSLGKVFDFRCMHIPVQDRTPFEELVEWVEKAVRIEHSLSPKRPIYLVGDSFGGCLALAVAARNPKVDLVVILANPATSFDRSQFQLFLPLLEALPVDLYPVVPNLLNIFMGDPIKMSSVGIDTLLHPLRYFEKITSNFIAAQPRLSSGLAAVLPKETLVWKLKLLKTGSAYANARLHAVKAEVLILASGKDFVIPSRDEALRLLRSIRNCKIRYFKDNGHTIFLEDGVNLLTIIKSTSTYRHSKNYDYVMDYLPPSMSEFKQVEENAWLRNFVSPVFYSTEEDGKIVKGLSGVPNEGPVILVSYHMFMGLEVAPLLEQFLREKKIMVRGIAHPTLFSQLAEGEFSITDYVTLYGALPVSASNLFKLFAMKSHVLLYPGGAREALHRKGEEYKLFWPDEPEFVRMAARFGATIVPFGVVGEDDIAKLVLDYDDLMKIPFLNERLKRDNEQYKSLNIRAGMSGEVANQPFHLPVAAPKIPGRFYYMFGKPIQTKGRKAMLKDKEKARELYRQIKCDVESNISYLLEKRKEDPYRGLINRAIYRAFRAPMDQVPSFET